MDKVLFVLQGGFLKGYRTALIAAGTIIGTVVIPWAVGDASLVDSVKGNWEFIAVALGLGAAAKH